MIHINNYYDQSSQGQKYEIPKDRAEVQKDAWTVIEDNKLMELMSKLMLAYPSTMSELNFQAPKKSFANWFIIDYLPTQIL